MPGTKTTDDPPNARRLAKRCPPVVLFGIFTVGVLVGVGIDHFLLAGHPESTTLQPRPN